MSRPIAVGDSVLVTLGKQSGSFRIMVIDPAKSEIQVTSGDGSNKSLIKYNGSLWSVVGLNFPHTISFKSQCRMSFFVSDKTTLKYDVDRLLPKVGLEFDCILTAMPEWDNANIIWKPVPKGLNWKELPNLRFFNNLITTPETLTRKSSLLNIGLQVYGNEFFNYHPYTELLSFRKIPTYSGTYPGLGTTAWITKPAASFGGEGIKLFWSPTELQKYLSIEKRPHVIQKYVERPLLYQGKKFDLRIFIFLTLDTIQIHEFMYARVAPDQYQMGSTDLRSNITNISLHEEFDMAVSLAGVGIEKEEVMTFVRQLKPLFQKAQEIERQYQIREGIKFHTFDFLGLDIIFDENRKAWLLEINKEPGFNSSRGGIYTETPRVLEDTLKEAIFFRLFPQQRIPTGFIVL